MPADPITGYLLVDAAQANVNDLAARLRNLDGIQFAHALLGPTDLIAYVETPDWDGFNALLNERIRELIASGLARRVETRLALRPRAGAFGPQMQTPPRGSAWIFIDLDMGAPEAVIGKLAAIDGIVAAHAVIGSCDIIAYLECEDWSELRTLLDDQIRTLPEIVRTDTRPVLMRRARRAPAQ